MKTKYFYNGKLVRTSERVYTHAVTREGEVITCCGSLELAQKAYNKYISNVQNEIIRLKMIIKALENGKSEIILKVGRTSGKVDITRHSIEEWKEYLEDEKGMLGAFQIIKLETI